MKKVICPGEALIDFVSMDIGKTLKATDGFIKKAGGAPANVAAAISKLGAEAYFCGTVGDDAFGGFLEDTLNNNNINTELLFKIKNNTTFAFVSLMENGERDFEFARYADECLTFDMISDRLEEFDLYHFGSATAFMGGNLKDTYFKLKEYAKSNNKIISFDANYRESLFGNNKEEFIKCCKEFIVDSNIVKLSEEEAKLISGIEDIKEASQYIVNLGCENLMVTLGKEGTLLSNREKQILIKTKEVKMKDATGAGDAFIGAVIAQILNEPGKSMEKIVEMANLVGGITTTKLGALESIPTWDEVFAYN
ncbi:carbohydrate kinase [uncultured Clostridium sp.]|uniref:carbohydrate kinase family protein n=1 Tax=uncultured Clostridium sp. TaxID=59620 RepID=UPI0026709CD5|nr:carbohydrate kinase [uncultured Clostridium sp.]